MEQRSVAKDAQQRSPHAPPNSNVVRLLKAGSADGRWYCLSVCQQMSETLENHGRPPPQPHACTTHQPRPLNLLRPEPCTCTNACMLGRTQRTLDLRLSARPPAPCDDRTAAADRQGQHVARSRRPCCTASVHGRHERVIQRADILHGIRALTGVRRRGAAPHRGLPLLHALHLLRMHRRVLHMLRVHLHLYLSGMRGAHHLRLREGVRRGLLLHLHLRRGRPWLVVAHLSLLAHVRLRAGLERAAVLRREVCQHLHAGSQWSPRLQGLRMTHGGRSCRGKGGPLLLWQGYTGGSVTRSAPNHHKQHVVFQVSGGQGAEGARLGTLLLR